MFSSKDWYEFYKDYTPKSYFFDVDNNLQLINSNNKIEIDMIFLTGPKIVKFNTVSPKDVVYKPVFNNIDTALNAISTSNRCQMVCDDVNTLMIREIDNDILTYPHKTFRCFIRNNKLRAISTQYGEPDEEIIEDPFLYKNSITEFISKIKYLESDIVIDIFCYPNINKILIIECNHYELSGGELFEWDEDVYLLTENDKVTFRYDSLFYDKLDI